MAEMIETVEEPSASVRRAPLFLRQFTLGDVFRIVPAIGLLGVVLGIYTDLKVSAAKTDDQIAAAVVEMHHAVADEAATRASHEIVARGELTSGLAALTSKIDTNQMVVNQQLVNTTEKLVDLKATLVDVLNASKPSKVQTR